MADAWVETTWRLKKTYIKHNLVVATAMTEFTATSGDDKEIEQHICITQYGHVIVLVYERQNGKIYNMKVVRNDEMNLLVKNNQRKDRVRRIW